MDDKGLSIADAIALQKNGENDNGMFGGQGAW